MLAVKLETSNTVVEINGAVIKDIKKVFKGHKKSKIEALNNLLVEINGNDQLVVNYITQDLTVQKSYDTIDLVYDNVSSFVLPISALKDMKGVKNDERFSIEVMASNKIVINRDGIEYPLYTMDRQDFPYVENNLYGMNYEEIETKQEGTNLLDRNDLEVFIKAGISVSNSETRPVLTGMNLHLGSVISTDSHRLFSGETIFAETNQDIILPVTIFEKAKDLSDKNDLFTVYHGDNGYVKIETRNLLIVERGQLGNYPQTDRLVPQDFKLEFKIEKIKQVKTVVESVKDGLVEMVYNKEKHEINLAIRNYITVTIAKNKTERRLNQEVKAVIPVQVMSDRSIDDGFKITFSAKYFLEALKQMDMEYVNLRIVANVRPFIIDNDKNKDFSLVLPVRTY